MSRILQLKQRKADLTKEAGAILLVGVTAVLSPIVFRAMSPPLPSESIESAIEEWYR